MSENKGNKKSPSAQDLLTRLKKKPEEKTAGEKKSSTYKDFLEKRNKNKNEEAIAPSFNEEKDAAVGSVYDEVYTAPDEAAAPDVSLDAAAAAFFEENGAGAAPVDDVAAYGEFLDPDLLEYAEETTQPAGLFNEEMQIPDVNELLSVDIENVAEDSRLPELEMAESPVETSFEGLFPELEDDYSQYLPDISAEEQSEEAAFAEIENIPVPEPVFDMEMAVPEIAEGAELYEQSAFEDVADGYGEYLEESADPFLGSSPEELAAYADAAGVTMAEEFAEPDEVAYGTTYSERPVIPVDGEYYEDVIPDDEFFDNDPIEDIIEEEYVEEEYIEEEYSEEKEFENLVQEVTGGAPVDELDENDISLMVALGMEDELAKTVGEETATQLTDDYVADQEEWVDRTNRFGADEYSDFAQNDEIIETYRKRSNASLLKMLLALFVSGVLLFFENVAVLGLEFEGALSASVYPVVHIMVDLQIFLVLVFFMGKTVLKGLKNIVSFKNSIESLPALLTVAAVVNSVVAAFMVNSEVEPRMFNFGAAFCLFLAAVSEYMTVRREMFSFSIISSDKPKYVMRRLSQRDSVLETEAVADIDAQMADESDIIKIQKTDFVDGYFWRTAQKGTCSRGVVGLAMVISVILAVVVSVYAFVKHEAYPVNMGFFTLCVSLPTTMVIAGFYPFYRANRKAFENESTIIGEGSVEEYSGVGVISFDDVNVFPSYAVKVRNVRLFNNSRIDKVLYYAASVFSETGGPLADVFEVATMETGHSDNVTILETGSGYIEADVNGRSIMFGKAQALAKHGILIPDDVVSENVDIPADCSVMYMIYQRKLVAKMIVNYVLDPDFEYVLKQLTGSGMCVCVKTFDPNIDEEMILRQLPQNNYALRVIKYKNTEEITKYSQRAEGGVVSRGDTKALLHTVASCDKILSAQKVGFTIGIISAILNAVLVGAILMSGQYKETLFSLYAGLLQIFWMIPVMITTKLIVR